ncbi:MAG TPA: serine hydrolase domain-containing protein, partial [Xanthobacteraceae bacterium]|nr:serine hydrolase domain-containing protein [Xanthobacteraceae bacterium]
MRLVHAQFDRFIEWLTDICCKQKIPPLKIDPSLAPSAKINALHRWLGGIFARGAFSGGVLIAQRGKIVFEQYYGFTDIGETTRLDAESSFSIASISKQFTGMGILLLEREGKVSVGDRLDKHIPELSPYGDITIEQLLHHTSGIPDHAALAGRYWD